MLDVTSPALSVDEVFGTLEAEGVLMVRFGSRRLRAVTHLDVDDDGIERALGALSLAAQGAL
jgi:threonine aldolase